MARVQIIVGSVMGTAMEVAGAAKLHLSAAGHSVQIIDQFQPHLLHPGAEDALLLCTSNTGVGNLPRNIEPFYRHLKNDFPAIAGLSYGVINLGDSSYPNFAEAGTRLDEAMADLGAVRLGDPLILDAQQVQDHPAAAQGWLAEWEQLL